MTVNVGVDDVLRRRGKRLERGVELFPIAHAIDDVGGGVSVLRRIESGPVQRVTFAVALEDDWTMSRHGYVLRDGVKLRAADPFSHLDLFVADDCILPHRWCLILLRIVGIEFLDIKILNVWSNIRETPGDVIVVANNDAGQTRRADSGDAHAGRAQVDHVPD